MDSDKMGRWLGEATSSARLRIAVMVLVVLAAAFPFQAMASSVTFSGPTNFSVGYSFVTPGGIP